MEILFKYVWILFIIVTNLNIFWLKSSTKASILDHPELEEGYEKNFKTIFIYGNLPWIIIGIGCISGMTNSVFDFFRPSEMKPIVLVFHAILILIWILMIRWVYFKDGAAFLEKHPGILKKRSFSSVETNVSAKEIKIFFPLMLMGGIAAMIMMWLNYFSFPF